MPSDEVIGAFKTHANYLRAFAHLSYSGFESRPKLLPSPKYTSGPQPIGRRSSSTMIFFRRAVFACRLGRALFVGWARHWLDRNTVSGLAAGLAQRFELLEVIN